MRSHITKHAFTHHQTCGHTSPNMRSHIIKHAVTHHQTWADEHSDHAPPGFVMEDAPQPDHASIQTI
eukprot:364768-Chlamydomonas_euryale.AAC.8